MFARTLKVIVLVLGLLTVPISASAQKLSTASPKYPLIESWKGKVLIVSKTGERTELKRSFILREHTGFVSEVGSSVVVRLDEYRSVTLGGGAVRSELVLPVISWETGEAPIVNFKEGDLRWVSVKAEKKIYNIALSSQLFQFIVPVGDFLFSLDPKKAFAEVKVLKGQMEFSASNAEDSVLVKSGEQASFQGVIEGGEIAYDILLQGRKIPKGKLSKVSKIDPKYFEAEKAKVKAAEDALKKAALAEAKKVAAGKRPGAICHQPEGMFNECSWRCEKAGVFVKGQKQGCGAGATCVRRRCNANGEWADRFELTAEIGGNMCKADAVVGACDY